MSRRPLGLRARLTLTFAMVSALVAVAVAGISFAIVRGDTWRSNIEQASREARVHLEDAAATLPLEPTAPQLRRFLTQVRARSTAEVVATLGDRTLTTAPRFTAAQVPDVVRGPVANGRVVAQRTTAGGEPVIVVGGAVVPTGPELYLFFPQQRTGQDLSRLAAVLAATSGALVVVSAAVGAAAASGLLRPIARTRAAVRSVAAGDLDARLEVEGDDELAELARAFNAMTAALRRNIGELRELEAGQRRFVSDVSHELRTPLTALTTACEVLEANTDGLTDAGRRAARLVVVESRRLAALVEDLMEISRMDAGAAEVTLERVDVTRGIAGALRSRGWDGDVQVRGDDDGVTVLMDARRLDAIIGNLVGNARTYGGPPVVVTVRSSGDDVCVDVTDHGDGIAPHHLQRIFERFYKVDRSRSAGGTGLGLAIARENARLHGGELTVVSQQGDGTTFTLRLPRRAAA
ncbi:MAG TPA: HAMP domain-containing sensor histidine kinase [Euzebyales bacterium]